MTQHKDLKTQIRARMRASGEKYTQARRSVLAARGPGGETALDAFADAIGPGRITAVLSGGGVSNLALALPTLARLLAAGHPLLYTTSGPEMDALPNELDFAIALGIASERELLDAFASRDSRHPGWEQVASLDGHIERLQGRLPYGELAARLSRRGSSGPPAVLWLQDFDDGGPVDLGRPGHGYREELQAQMPWLRRLADETGAVIALGHLDYDLDVRADWWPIAEHADTTFHTARDVEQPGSEDFWVVFDGTSERGLLPGKAAFSDWRYQLIKLRAAERAAGVKGPGGA